VMSHDVKGTCLQVHDFSLVRAGGSSTTMVPYSAPGPRLPPCGPS